MLKLTFLIITLLIALGGIILMIAVDYHSAAFAMGLFMAFIGAYLFFSILKSH